MAKNKKKPQPQLLSPENYIRQKARNLPVYECLINDGWDNTGTASIVISRIHANDNLTVGVYLVDLLCLGVKDAFYMFNAPMAEYLEMLDSMRGDFEMVKVDYSLVHNVILAANEFAAELGFKPHKDFTAVAQYILEEDTDDIELMEIECGKNGRPLYIQHPDVLDGEANRVIKQLERAVGEGNFDVITGEEEDELYDDEEDELYHEEEVKAYMNRLTDFNGLTYDQKVSLFRELSANGLEKIPVDDKKRLIALTDSIFTMDICNSEEVDRLIESWKAESDMPTDEEEFSARLLSQMPESIITEDEENELYELDDLINDNPQKFEKHLRELKKKWGNIPYLNYKELKHLEINKHKEYEKRAMDVCGQFSEYPLFKIELNKFELLHAENIASIQLIKFEDIFGNLPSITETEMFDFQLTKYIMLLAQHKTNELEAMYSMIDDLDLSDTYYNYLKTTVMLGRINYLSNLLE